MLDIEAGYSYSAKVVSAGVNLYYMLYRDQLVQTGELSDTGELLSRNVARSYRRGVELQVEVRATKWLTLSGNATLSQNHILGYVDYIDDIAFERGRTTIAVLKRFSPALHQGLGVYLPLITTNCAVLGVSINNITDKYTFIESIVSSLGCGLGFLLAYDIEKALAEIKARTSHLKGLKIGVMGCIVNGPGEMADADYGYVGAGAGRISLYKGKECIERNIPQEEALERLIELIKANGDWKEK